MNSSDTVIKDLGNNLYELSCPPILFYMFGIEEILAVGDTVRSGQEIAVCSTENMLYCLYVDFPCRVVKVNQVLIDYALVNNGIGTNDKAGFAQTDWICVVEKIDNAEN